MTRSEDTDAATRRGFLRSATAGAAAVSAGVAGASASAAAQSENETTNPMGNETDDGNETGGHSEEGGHSEGGGQFVLTDSILMMLGFIVVGVLSPIAFAAFLARNYGGDTPE